MSVCFVYFLIFLLFSLVSYFLSLSFMSSGYGLILEINMVDINSCSIVMTLLFDWMSLLFASFVMFISCMVILMGLNM